MSNPNCPFCGAEDIYKCGSWGIDAQETRNPLCREREAHNNTKRERDKARNLVQSGIRAQASLNEALDKTLYDLRMALEQNAKLRDIAEMAMNFGQYRAPYFAYPNPTWEKMREQLKEASK